VPKRGNVQHLLICGMAVLLLGVLAGCGSGGVTPADGQPEPAADLPVENGSPSETDAGASPNNDPSPAPLENEAFRVWQPVVHDVVGMTFKVEGESRTFEGQFHYSLEDGHNILAEGVVQTDAGAPKWAPFSIDIELQEAPTSPHGVLLLYEASAQDGRPTHQLAIPLTFDESIVQYD